MKKIAIALTIAMVMSMALTACGGGTSSSGSQASSGSQGAASSQPAGSGDSSQTSSLTPKDGGTRLTFTTGGETGTYYAFGNVIGNKVGDLTSTSVTTVASGGSAANIQSMQRGDAQLGFVQSDVMAYAYDGIRSFEETGAVTDFSTVAALYMEQVQIVTVDPAIKTVADLAGKRVSVGAAGSGVYFNAVDILSAYGIGDLDADGKFTKINATYQSFSDSADALKNGQIDAAFIVAGAPTTAVADLAATKSVNLVSLDDEHIAKLLESSPYYTKCVIPAETYGMAGDVTTVGVGAVVLVRDDVSEDAVYALCADIFDNAASLVDTHAKYGEISLDYGASMTAVPYHAGAAKYFAEKGFTVPSK